MNYLRWNQELYTYFFADQTTESVVLACTPRIIESIAEKNQLTLQNDDDESTAVEQFLKCVKRIHLNGIISQLDEADQNSSVLRKAEILRWAWNNKNEYRTEHGLPKVFHDYKAPPYIAVLCALSLIAHQNDLTSFWDAVDDTLGGSTDRGLLDGLFNDLKEKEPRFHFFLLINHVHVGKIFSQTPLMQDDELLIKEQIFRKAHDLQEDFGNFDLSYEVETMLDGIANRLEPRTQRYWRRAETERRVMIQLVAKNLEAYTEEIQDNEHVWNEILELEKRKREKKIPIRFEQFIELHRGKFSIRPAVLISERAIDLDDWETFTFSKKGHSFDIPARHLLIELEDEFFYCLFCEGLPPNGKYKAAPEIPSARELTVKSTTAKPIFPIFYEELQSSSSQDRKYYHIKTQKKLTTNTRLLHNDAPLAGPYELVKRDFAIKGIDGKVHAYKINPSLVDKKLNAFGRTIARVDSKVQVDIKGLIVARNQYLNGYPIYISVSGGDAARANLIQLEREECVYSTEIIELSETPVFHAPLDEGEYRLEIVDAFGNRIIPPNHHQLEFSVSSAFPKDTREELSILKQFKIDEATDATNDYPSALTDSNHSIPIPASALSDIIDACTSIGGVRGHRSEKFRKHIIPKNLKLQIQEIERSDPGFGFDRLINDLAKELFRVFEFCGFVEETKKGNYFWVKPHWARVTGEMMALRGALRSTEREKYIGDPRNVEQSIDIKVKNASKQLVFRVQLPVLPYRKANEIDLETHPLIVAERSTAEFNLPALITKQIEQTEELHTLTIDETTGAFVHARVEAAVSIARFDWMNFKFDKFETNEEFSNHISYAGKHLIRIQERLNQTNIRSHYFIFNRSENNPTKTVKYYGADCYAEVKYAFIKELKHFNLSQPSTAYRENELKTFLSNLTTRDNLKRQILEADTPFDLKEILNETAQIGLIAPKFKKTLFVYDEEKRLFGYCEYLRLPKSTIKSLINVSGLLPVRKQLLLMDLKACLEDYIKTNQKRDCQKVRELPFFIHFDIDKSTAEEISKAFTGITGTNYTQQKIDL